MKGRDVILGILSRKERTGYDIKNILETQLSYFYDGTYGMIYPTLRKLEAEGKIKKEIVIQEGRPNKNVFAITEAGREEFAAYFESDVDVETVKSDLLMRLFFAPDLSKENLQPLLTEGIARKEERIQQLQDNLQAWQGEGGLTSTQEITIKYGLAYYQATKQVLEAARKDLEK